MKNVMRCLTVRDWGVSCSALKTIYVAMIRSVFDYGCVSRSVSLEKAGRDSGKGIKGMKWGF